MNNYDYEMAVRGAATISENDIAAVVIRIDDGGEIRVGAYGDARGIDTIYDRICRAYLQTLSQEALDKFINAIGLEVYDKPDEFKTIVKNCEWEKASIHVIREKNGDVFCSVAGGSFSLCSLHKNIKCRCSNCPLPKVG